MDDMARRMRTGYDFNCPAGGSGNCEGGKKSIEFTRSHVGSGNDPFIQYRLSGGKIQRQKSVSGNSTGWLDLTDEQITISNLQFFLTGENYSAIDSQQTRVLVSVTGTVGSGDTAETFTVQTTIAQRLLFSPDN